MEDFLYSASAASPRSRTTSPSTSPVPNTAEGKTFEDPAAFDGLLAAVMAVRV